MSASHAARASSLVLIINSSLAMAHLSPLIALTISGIFHRRVIPQREQQAALGFDKTTVILRQFFCLDLGDFIYPPAAFAVNIFISDPRQPQTFINLFEMGWTDHPV